MGSDRDEKKYDPIKNFGFLTKKNFFFDFFSIFFFQYVPKWIFGGIFGPKIEFFALKIRKRLFSRENGRISTLVFFWKFRFFAIFKLILSPKIPKKSIFRKSPKITKNTEPPCGYFGQNLRFSR